MTVLLPPPEEEEDGRRGGQLCGRRLRERKRQKKYKGDFEGNGNHHYRPLHTSSSSSSSSATANGGEQPRREKTEDARGRGGHCFKEEDDDDDEDGRGCHHDHQQQQQQHSSHRFVNHHNHHYHHQQQQHHLHLQHHLKRWWRSWPWSPPLLSSLPSPPSLPSSSSLSSSRRQLSANEINRRRSSRSDCRQYGSLLKRRGGTAVFQHLLIAVAISSIVLFTGGTSAIAKDGDQLLQPGHHHHHQMSPSLEGFSDLKEDLMFEDSLDVATSHYLSDDGQADRVVMSSSDGRVINSSTVYRQIESPNAIPGDHILRPFSRQEKRNQLHTQQQQQQQQQGQQIPPQPQLNPRNTNAFRRHQLSSQDFSLPVVDLKRISGDSNNRYPNNQLVPPHQGPGPFFKKRLPLMEEGFLLSPAPNSAGSLERRQDFVQEERHPVRGSRGTSSDSFRRRFGDGLAHESVNFNSNGGGNSHGSGEVSTGDQHHHHHHHHLRAFLEDSDDNELSLNDLDLDDIAGPMPPQQGQRGLANHPKNGHHPNHNNNHPHQQHHHSHSHNHNHHHHHTAHQQQNFKALRKPIRSAQFGGDHGSAVLPPPPPPPPPSSSAVPPSPSTSTGGGGNPAPSGAPISQIMPLFFDKFLAEFGNAHLPPLSPEGFSLPPSPASPVAPPPPPPTSSADLEASRGGGPPSSTLPGGIHLKPEIGPPLFSNDLVQPSPPPPPSSAEFGGDGGGGGSSSPAVSSGPPWPKIFRFTDGRINLHDFEREKKRSRVKFSAKLQMASKAALYNIKRESFLILHGGTFSQ